MMNEPPDYRWEFESAKVTIGNLEYRLEAANKRIAAPETKLVIATAMLKRMARSDALGWEEYAQEALEEIERVGK